ncbi:S-layer homology domain-containing protein [Desulfocurvus sp. DL9XJH121]
MTNTVMARLRPVHLLLLALALALGGCAGQQPRTPSGVMDSPSHHFHNGLAALDKGDAAQAEAEFQSALSTGVEYPPALAGLGVAAAMRGSENAEDQALDLVDEARDAADDWDPSVRMWPEVMEIRALTELYRRGKLPREDFLEGLEGPYKDAVDFAPSAPEPPFYLAEAYVAALEFGPAEEMYYRVLTLGHGYEDRAEKRWRLVQDVNRAAPGSAVGKEIALVEELTRADLAALMAVELDVDKFYTRTSDRIAPGFAAPGRNVAVLEPEHAVTDIATHPMRADIEKVLRYGVRGLDLYPDRTFRPDAPVTRAEAAMIFEDVVVRATGRAELGTQYIGQDSRLPDMRGDHPAYNAAMLCITRGIMDADIRSGAFRPMDPVSGVEALLAVKALRRELSLF